MFFRCRGACGMNQPFGEAALDETRAHPRFREAVEQFARARASHFRRLDSALRWATTDLGRSMLARAAVVLDRRSAGLTAKALLDTARTLGLCSRGRALAFLEGAQKRSLLTIPFGEGHWMDRPIQPSARLVGLVEDAARNLLAAARLLTPRLTGSAHSDDLALERLLAAMAALPTHHPAVLASLPAPIRQFMEHDGALRMLDELISRQPARRTRLLEATSISRLALARAAGVSRAQAARLLEGATAEGLIFQRGGELDFSPAFSDGVELRFALIFRVAQLSAEGSASA